MNKSKFDGNPFQLLGWIIVGFFITFFTLGICYPWALVLILKWQTRHTIIDGKRLYFDGTGAELLGNWVLWLVLILITGGIYGFWVSTAILKWATAHTHFVEEDSSRQMKSNFDGNPFQLLGWIIVGFFITFFTLGICYPWALVLIIKWQTRHTIIDGKRLLFDGTGAELLGNWILWMILTIMTAGIYGFWVSIAILKWLSCRTHILLIEPREYFNKPSPAVPLLKGGTIVSQGAHKIVPAQVEVDLQASSSYSKTCDSCGNKNPQDATFCAFCGTVFSSKEKSIFCEDVLDKQKLVHDSVINDELMCDNCQAKVYENEAFCSSCGQRIKKNVPEKIVPPEDTLLKSNKETKEECLDGTWSVSISTDWVYFRNVKDGSMHRIRHDGSDREVLKDPIEENE